jgi:hypothetical protein
MKVLTIKQRFMRRKAFRKNGFRNPVGARVERGRLYYLPCFGHHDGDWLGLKPEKPAYTGNCTSSRFLRSVTPGVTPKASPD